MKRPNILHLTFDYAENNVGKSTVVVRDLIRESSKFTDTKVISLRRNINPFKEKLEIISENFISYKHFGLPYGIGIKTNMYRIGRPLKKILSMDNNFDFVHAHKLTYEGFIGYYIANKMNKKLLISIRQTDFFVLKYRKDLIDLSKKILLYSSIIFYIAPYMLNRIKNIFGEEFYKLIENKFFFLPNSLDFDKFHFYSGPRDKHYLSAFWMEKKSVKRKNVRGLFEAVKLLNDPDFRLKIIGYGSYENELKSWIKELSIGNNIKFLGFVDNKEISQYISKSMGFLLPSFSETFGVVYAEALLCGTPILYSKNTGFDGIFENVGVSVNPHSVQDIASGIKTINEKNEDFIKSIKELYSSNKFDIFKKESVALNYYKVINNL